MTHQMKLQAKPFERIKQGTKTIEMRLHDEKRQIIKKGDRIIFTNLIAPNQTLEVEVLRMHLFDSFKSLYKSFNKTKLGYNKKELANYKDMLLYYSTAEQTKFGVVGIEIKLIKT